MHRRHFIGGALAAGGLAHLGDFSFLGQLPTVTADEARVRPETVQLSSDLEPLVRLIEDTPREKAIDTAVDKVRTGTSYQQLLAAVLLAGVRGIKPRPVGFKFHAVLVINSAHLASLAAPDSERWLPLLWAIDNFKSSQAANLKDNAGWMMPPVDEAKLPRTADARQRFIDAMDGWDEEGADVAVAALARTAGAEEIIELFWRYGARDFRDIGHKAIYVANSWRLLQTVGWRHAEPVLRSLAFALLEHEGSNPAQRDGEPDLPWRENIKRAAKIRGSWQNGKQSPDAVMDLLQTIRTGSHAEAADKVVELLDREIHPASIWDGIFLAAGELMLRQPGIVGLHCATSANALYQAYMSSANDETRRMMMLQASSFLTLFRKAMQGRGKVREDVRIDRLMRAEPQNKGPEAIAEIFAEVSKDRLQAARMALACLEDQEGAAAALMTAARRLVFNKGNDAHDYKFSSAALEDHYHVTPKWRRLFLASCMANLRGAGDPDNELVKRARAALAKS
jgi:hypothetical protein